MSFLLKSQVWLTEKMAQTLPPGDAFEAAMSLRGELFRDMPARKTMRVWLSGRPYFVKQHLGVGWKEIFKNLLSAKVPVLGAETEWRAIQRLHALGIPTMTAVAFGSRGFWPATRRSFLLTEDLGDIVSLEDFCQDWARHPPPLDLKRKLLEAVANIAHSLHEGGLQHRDFYLGHFCLDKGMLERGVVRIYLIDLHRTLVYKRLPTTGRIKDMAALYSSSMGCGFGRRDLLRFLRRYRNKPLREILEAEGAFWNRVGKRADALHIKYQRRFASLPKVRR